MSSTTPSFYSMTEIVISPSSSVIPSADKDVDFHVIGHFGRYDYRKVLICKRTSDNTLCVFKRFDSRKYRASFNREVSCLKRLANHSLIVDLIWHEVDQSGNLLSIYTNLACGGTISGLLMAIDRPLQPQEAFFYLAELTETVMYIHEKDILHHDIKEDNIFIQSDGHILLGDFGLARDLSLGDILPNSWRIQSAHMPSEVHMDYENYPKSNRKYFINHAVDWFSVGVFLYALLHLKVPFSKPLIPENSPFHLHLNKALSKDLHHLVRGLLDMNAEKRIGASKRGGAEVFLHPWMRDNAELQSVLELKGVEGVRKFIRNKELMPPFKPLPISL